MTKLILVVVALQLSGCEKKKQPAPSARPQAANPGIRQSPPPRPGAQFAGRRGSDGMLEVYVDEKLQRSINTKELEEPRPLRSLIGDGAVRNVLAHGDSDMWIRGTETADYDVRVNRRGAIKIEWKQGEAGGGGGGGGGRARELRDVRWLEVRSPSSPRLVGEP
jgi:hypothetical protein